ISSSSQGQKRNPTLLIAPSQDASISNCYGNTMATPASIDIQQEPTFKDDADSFEMQASTGWEYSNYAATSGLPVTVVPNTDLPTVVAVASRVENEEPKTREGSEYKMSATTNFVGNDDWY